MHRAVRIAVALALVAFGVAGAAVAQRSPESAAATTRVTVRGDEFLFMPKNLRIRRGTLVVTFRNIGTLGHNFAIKGKGKTRVINPGASVTKRFTGLTRGTYRILCTVPGHAAAGMRGTLRVR